MTIFGKDQLIHNLAFAFFILTAIVLLIFQLDAEFLGEYFRYVWGILFSMSAMIIVYYKTYDKIN